MSAYFVLSPGRCGTQWLAQRLSALCDYNLLSNKYWITHEPLQLDYIPSRNTPVNPLKYNADAILAHKEAIRKHVLGGGSYIECGFPCWRHLEWFKSSLEDICDIGVIYIHREPIINAISLLKISSFVPPLFADFPTKVVYLPNVDCHMPQYCNLWNSLSPFEKNLVYWAEVQLQAEAYRNSWGDHNWLTLAFEDMFTVCAQKRLAGFLKLEHQDKVLKGVDRFSIGIQCQIDPDEYNKHLAIQEIAHSLGYMHE